MKIGRLQFCYLLLPLIIMTSCGSTQDVPMRYRHVDDYYLDMDYYPSDTTAKAVVLGDYGILEINYHRNKGFTSYFTRHKRVKIFDKDAFDVADFHIRLYSSGSSRERITRLRGNTFNKEGNRVERVRFSRGDAYEEEVSDHLTSVNFSLPAIREGSVFEIEYTIESPFLQTLPTWYFQSEYPTVFSEFRMLIPEYFNYRAMMQGFLVLDSVDQRRQNRNFTVEWEENHFLNQTSKHSARVDYEENQFFMRIEDAPAFTVEPFMNAPVNYLSKIEHELLSFRMPHGRVTDYSSSWGQLNDQLLRSSNFGGVFNRTRFIGEEKDRIMAQHPEPEERLIAAFKLIQSEMTWNRNNGLFATQSLRRSWDDKQGNAADINLMLVMLLRELDIDADPVILSTRANGIIPPMQIMLKNFNYVIARASIDGQEYLLDATEDITPYFLLPERCINDKGRLVVDGEGKWIDLKGDENNILKTESELFVKNCGSVEAKIVRKKQNQIRLRMLDNYNDYDSPEDYMDEFEASGAGLELISFEMAHDDDWGNPLETVYEFEIPETDPGPRDIIYVNPLLNDQMESNPFRREERLFPVDFVYPVQREYKVKVNIPEGYVVDELPVGANFRIPGRNGGASYKSTFVINGDQFIEVQIQFDLSKPLFTAEEYSRLREFFARVVEEQARVIVLKKLS